MISLEDKNSLELKYSVSLGECKCRGRPYSRSGNKWSWAMVLNGRNMLFSELTFEVLTMINGSEIPTVIDTL